MPDYPRFAPGTLPYYLDRILWVGYRLAAVVFLFSVLVTLIVRANQTVAAIAGISFVVWIGGWIGHRLLHQYWND